jgi:hypothetical protein
MFRAMAPAARQMPRTMMRATDLRRPPWIMTYRIARPTRGAVDG